MRTYIPSATALAKLRTPQVKCAVYVPSGNGIPERADNSQYFGPIQNQENLGACTAFASLQWYAAWQVKQGKAWQEYSELAQYYEERKIEHTIHEDSGAYGHDAVYVLEHYGVMLEIDDPYEVEHFENAPPRGKFLPHSKLPAKLVRSIDPAYTLDHALDALANGYSILFGFVCYPGLESAHTATTGVLPMPAPHEQPIGGHEVVAVGFDQTRRMIKVRNQWGAWGDNGYFWMPYEYFRLYTSELYIIEQ
jgi:C1A family cysteine protease